MLKQAHPATKANQQPQSREQQAPEPGEEWELQESGEEERQGGREEGPAPHELREEKLAREVQLQRKSLTEGEQARAVPMPKT
jgi:hypothetical protein